MTWGTPGGAPRFTSWNTDSPCPAVVFITTCSRETLGAVGQGVEGWEARGFWWGVEGAGNEEAVSLIFHCPGPGRGGRHLSGAGRHSSL